MAAHVNLGAPTQIRPSRPSRRAAAVVEPHVVPKLKVPRAFLGVSGQFRPFGDLLGGFHNVMWDGRNFRIFRIRAPNVRCASELPASYT